ncbi:MAG: class II aldolase/adducin family protein [Thermoleophilia bacterium]|nr:class II aldolase/adducin family protein [Thermoleophilia bacterium]
MQDLIFEQFQQVGKDLLWLGLSTSHGGNMSVRHAGHMIVTTHFAMLGRLGPGDLVEIPLREEPDRIAGGASSDAGLHQLIYRFTPAAAIIHAHPPHAIALSLRSDMIAPRDLEGSVFLREVPVVDPEQTNSRIPQVLQTHVAAVIRGHGSYVVGRTLSEALAYTSALGFSSHVAYLDELLTDKD